MLRENGFFDEDSEMTTVVGVIVAYSFPAGYAALVYFLYKRAKKGIPVSYSRIEN